MDGQQAAVSGADGAGEKGHGHRLRQPHQPCQAPRSHGAWTHRAR